MLVQNTQTIDAPLDLVWQIFGREFANAQAWSSFVHKSEAKTGGPKVGDAEITGRTCETPIGHLDETLLIYSEARKELKFSVKAKGLPFFMKGIQSHWSFAEANGKTRADTEVELDVIFPFNLLMGWALRRNFRKTLNQAGAELAAHAKTRG